MSSNFIFGISKTTENLPKHQIKNCIGCSKFSLFSHHHYTYSFLYSIKKTSQFFFKGSPNIRTQMIISTDPKNYHFILEKRSEPQLFDNVKNNNFSWKSSNLLQLDRTQNKNSKLKQRLIAKYS